MTQTEKLLICIANAGGPIRTAELEKQSGIPAKNHRGLLATPISKGLVYRCDIINGNGRKCSEYRIGVSYTPANAEKAMKQPEAVIKAEDGRQLLRDADEIGQETAHFHAQPEVAKNTGSDGSASPPQFGCPAEAIAPIEYTAASAQTVQELANALDKINELKRQIAALELDNNNLRKSCDVLDLRLREQVPIEYAAPSALLLELQTYLEEGVCIQIGEDYIQVVSDGRAYSVDATDCMQVVSICVDLGKRLAA